MNPRYLFTPKVQAMRREYPLPKVVYVSRELITVGQTRYEKSRLDSAIEIYTRMCRCERCDACLAGKATCKGYA